MADLLFSCLSNKVTGDCNVAYVIIQDACIACGTCREECPSAAVVESEGKFCITDECIECAACLESCPSGAVIDG